MNGVLMSQERPDFDLGISREAQEHATNLAWLVLAALALVIVVFKYLGRRRERDR